MMKFIAPFLILAASMLFGGHAEAQSFVIGVTSCGTAPTTIVNGRPAYLTVDLNGNLCPAATGGGTPAATNITQWASVTLGAPSAYGTSPGAVIVPGVNAFVTNFPATQPVSGTVTVVGPTPDGSAASTNPVLIAGTTDGTATGLVAVPKVTAGGVMSVDGSSVTQPISAASLPLPSGAATSAAQTTMATNQTSGGQKTQITDSSGNAAVVTAASTTSPATDRSLSVTLNAGSNGLITPGTAGTPGSQVITMQGIASMTPILQKLSPSASSVDGITPTASGSAGASLVLKASAGNFYSGSAVNTTATAGFCLIVNATSAPTTGSVVTPLMFAVLPANGSCSLGVDSGIPSVFSTGITFLVSSNASPFTFTSGTITAAISGKVM